MDKRLDSYIDGIGITNNGKSVFIPSSVIQEKRIIPANIGSESITLTSDKKTEAITLSGGHPIYTPAYWYSWSAFYPNTTIE